MAEKRSVDEFIDIFKNLHTSGRTERETKKVPFKPLLLLSLIISYENNKINLNDIPTNPENEGTKFLLKTWDDLGSLLKKVETRNKIHMPMYHMAGKEDGYIWNIEFNENYTHSAPSSLKGLNGIVERISLDEDLIEYIEDSDSLKQLISAIFDGGYFFEDEKNNILKLDVFRGMSNGFDLRKGLLKVLDEYPTAKNEAFTQHPLANFIRNKLPEGLSNIITNNYGDNNFKTVTGSPGLANWANVPWIAVLDERETNSVQRGVFVVYLYSSDMNRLYLTLMQGVTEYKKKYSSVNEARKMLLKTSDKIRESIEVSEHVKTDQNINLDSGGYGKDYEYGTIFYKEYNKNDFPSDEELKEDLIEFVDIYDDYLDLEEELIEEDTVYPQKDKSNFFEYLHNKGFIFDKEIVENFLLSLKVKPFVILTGTTGTGKTKLAQLYGQYLDQTHFHTEVENDKIVTSVKVGKSYDSGGWSVSKGDFFKVFSDLEKLEKPYKIKVDGIDGQGRLQLTPRLFYYSDSDEIIERLKTLEEEDPNQRIELEIQVDENVLSKDKKSHREGRLYEIIPVGSDWTDNKNIIGFYNVITGEYQETPALDLIFRAMGQEEYPHIIILDEMNLSHVERYFSDFLSAIESGEQIPLHSKEGLMDVPTDLSVPENIFIVGTVNIDETTYMFSPKVLDRANTIEFLTIPAIEYMSTEIIYDPPTGDTKYLEEPLSGISLRNTSIEDLRDKFEKIKAEDGRPFWDVYSKEINKFQKTLKGANFDFGFRVINEITRFMYASWIYEKQPTTWDNWRRYFDAQIKQKMLPKVHGSQRELGNVLEDLFKLCYTGIVDKQVRNMTELEDDENVIYRSSALKIHEMSKTLYNQRYVSFTK